MANDSIIIPPCLLSGQSYRNTCKRCNYTGLVANVSASVVRSGVISVLGRNPLGLVAPSIAVSPGGSIVIVAGYSGPGAHPNSTMLAYPGGSGSVNACATLTSKLVYRLCCGTGVCTSVISSVKGAMLLVKPAIASSLVRLPGMFGVGLIRLGLMLLKAAAVALAHTGQAHPGFASSRNTPVLHLFKSGACLSDTRCADLGAGIASMTIAPNSTDFSWRVLRTGVGKVKSTSGRWTDFSSLDMTPLLPNATAAPAAVQSATGDGTNAEGQAAALAVRLYYGVQWSQRVVECDSADNSNDAAEYEPVCAMPAPWIGQLTVV